MIEWTNRLIAAMLKQDCFGFFVSAKQLLLTSRGQKRQRI